jgi:hypothetical protein
MLIVAAWVAACLAVVISSFFVEIRVKLVCAAFGVVGLIALYFVPAETEERR